MPSEYPSKQEMRSRQRESSDLGRPHATEPAERRRGGSKTAMSGIVQRLAASLGRDPDELAKKIDPDVIRRTKFPVIEERLEDGTIKFKHDPGIIEGPRASVRR